MSAKWVRAIGRSAPQIGLQTTARKRPINWGIMTHVPGYSRDHKNPQERGGAVKKTESEQLFEDYCDHVKIPWTHIEVGASKTADYSLSVDGQVVIAEVKEVTRNPEEQASDRQIKETRIGKGMRGKPGARVRKKITDSLQQIKD